VKGANKPRCSWAKGEIYERYHDEEWGVPVHHERKLFEMLVLEGAQAGLSWITILKKRDAYRRAFDDFDPAKIARYDARKVARLLADEGIVRNRLKIAATIGNARALLAMYDEGDTLDKFVWKFVEGAPLRVARTRITRSEASDAMSRALQKRGFRYVGTTIMYAFMQACGLVNDHEPACFLAPRPPRRRIARAT
jgi:DNA-3-methyladenine glycosylase I